MSSLPKQSDSQLSEDQRISWENDGFIVLRKFFDTSVVDEINELVDTQWAGRNNSKNKLVIDAFLNSEKYRRMLFKDAPDEARNSAYKLNDLYLESSKIREVILDETLCGMLSELLTGTPLVCNSLNFEYGSEQDKHIDSFYMTPRIRNRLAATWIALDSIGEDNGPVRYYPGSHKIPVFSHFEDQSKSIEEGMLEFQNFMEEELEQREIKPVSFTAEPGDVLIWHAQLLHGGAPMINKELTRKSLVTHYFCKEDYRRRFWRIRKTNDSGYYYSRAHQKTESSSAQN